MNAMDLGVAKLNYLDDLGMSVDDYVIGASGAMVAHRLLEKNDDLDIVVKPDTLAKLVYFKKLKLVTKKSVSGHYIMSFTDKSGNIDAAESMRYDLETPTAYWFNESVVINGHRYLSVPQLKVFYRNLYENYGIQKHKIRLDILEKVK